MPSTSPALPLSVMTFNLRCDTPIDGPNRWGFRKDLVAEVIRSKRPMVLGVQEPFRHQLADLEIRLPEYAWVGLGRDDGAGAGEHSALFYLREELAVEQTETFWFSPTPESPGPAWGARHPRICTAARFRHPATSRRFWVFNLHLDHESQLARERGAALVRERISQRHPAEPALLCGDFNATETNPALRHLLAPDSPVGRDLFRESNPSAPGGTFHGFTGKPGDRIDYVLGSPEWEVEASEVLRVSEQGRYPSDHFPVWCKLRLP